MAILGASAPLLRRTPHPTTAAHAPARIGALAAPDATALVRRGRVAHAAILAARGPLRCERALGARRASGASGLGAVGAAAACDARVVHAPLWGVLSWRAPPACAGARKRGIRREVLAGATPRLVVGGIITPDVLLPTAPVALANELVNHLATILNGLLRRDVAVNAPNERNAPRLHVLDRAALRQRSRRIRRRHCALQRAPRRLPDLLCVGRLVDRRHRSRQEPARLPDPRLVPVDELRHDPPTVLDPRAPLLRPTSVRELQAPARGPLGDHQPAAAEVRVLAGHVRVHDLRAKGRAHLPKGRGARLPGAKEHLTAPP
mmetsp:Transcript_50435/g.141776  ORF Transcript_50435/g.141776 Transcript_50435/m.141776 type:complete len:319 (+) Transcript_50435:98-1054(+)